MYNQHENQQRECPICGNKFVAANSRKEFCSDRCRANNHAQKKVQERLSQDVKVAEQSQRIQHLTDAPVTRTQVVKKVNPEWRLLEQAYSAESALCTAIRIELSEIVGQKDTLVRPVKWIYLGAGVGASLAMMIIAPLYSARKRGTSPMPFIVISFISLIWCVVVFQWLGRRLQSRVIERNSTTQLALAELNEKESCIKDKLKAAMEKVAERHKEMNQLPQYIEEVVTSVKEIRDTTNI